MSESSRLAFVCVENAGRSQMAAAFATEWIESRGLEDRFEVVSGGTDPADHVHEVVIEAMAERGIDLSDAEPTVLPREAILAVDHVITMGCSADDVCPATWRGDSRDWDLEDPGGKSLETVRSIRDEIENRVATLLANLRDGTAHSNGLDPAL
jgi:protein-tyrosine-phosphatase